MAKKRIKSTAKMARGYEPGDFTYERSSRLGAVRGGEGATTVVRIGGDSSPDAPAQALGSLASEDDAPFDGVAYERKDGEWVAAGAGGGLADGDYGDVTVSGTGTAIAIDNNAVTFAKMQDIGAGTVIGADSAGDPKALNVIFPLVAKSGNLSQYGVGTVEVNLGATPRFQGRFTIADLEISASRVVQCWQAPGPYTGKGTRADEAEMQPVQVIAVSPGSGSATVYWQTPPAYTMQDIIPDGRRDAPSTVAGFDPRYPYVQRIARRTGLVRGNVKFYYSVA